MNVSCKVSCTAEAEPMISIKRGLNLPITGLPEQAIYEKNACSTVALVGDDYPGMKPTMAVQVGDSVKRGQVLFSDKQNPGIDYTAPASGTVAAIHRGAKRVFRSLVIDVAGDDSESFAAYSEQQIDALSNEQIRENLQRSGLWTAFRTRPFSKVPSKDAIPHAIFVTAIDTHPLAADPAVIIQQEPEAFAWGLRIVQHLSPKKVYLCKAPGADIPQGQAITHEFSGPHPAGLVGTHMHFLCPANAQRTLWHLGYQDVIAIGKLFQTGQLCTERVISLAGPGVEKPRLLKTCLGASITELVAGNLREGEQRSISGSVFGGRIAQGEQAYLGRYHNQVSVLLEGKQRKFMGWLSVGSHMFSVMNICLSKLNPKKRFAFTTSTHGSARAMIPVGNYERVMPLDILPVQLLRALIVGDTEMAQKLGALELDEDDLALCTFVCAGKYEYGPILRDNLTRIEKEG